MTDKTASQTLIPASQASSWLRQSTTRMKALYSNGSWSTNRARDHIWQREVFNQPYVMFYEPVEVATVGEAHTHPNSSGQSPSQLGMAPAVDAGPGLRASGLLVAARYSNGHIRTKPAREHQWNELSMVPHVTHWRRVEPSQKTKVKQLFTPNPAPYPRITDDSLKALICQITYLESPVSPGCLCVLHLHSGYQIWGHHACMNPANYTSEEGKDRALAEALSKLRELHAYHLLQDRWNKAPDNNPNKEA